MGKRGMRGIAALGVVVGLACVFAGPTLSRFSRLSWASTADDDPSASLIGSWRGTRKALGTSPARHNLLSFLPGGVAMESGASAYVTGQNFGNGTFMETEFIGTWVSEGHGNFVAHLISNLSEPPPGKGTPIGTENLTFRFHIENGKNGKELKGTLEGIFLDTEGNTLGQLPAGLTWDATPLTITSNGYN
jgi:hypothetical protein